MLEEPTLVENHWTLLLKKFLLVFCAAPPSPPGRPVVIDITETRCTLRWEPSEDDGGADVKHYIVEYFRDVWDVWLKAKTTKECQVVL